MATNINLIPKAASNLLSGKLQSALSASASYFVGDVVPSTSKLPTYFWIDYGASNAELTKAYEVSGSNVYIKRGLNNGGVGLAHNSNASYYEAITIEHWNTMVDVLQNGFVLDHTDVYTFSRVSSTSFTISGVDRTNYYQTNTLLRFNGTDTARVTSSSYGGGNTTVDVNTAVVPATISSVELFMPLYMGKEHNPDGTHDSSKVAMLDGAQTFTGVKTFSSTPKMDAISENTSNTGVTIDGVLLKDNGVKADTLYEKTTNSGVTVKKVVQTWVTATDDATVTFDLSYGNLQKVTLGGNRTLTVSNVSTGQCFIIKLIQDSTGGRTVSWFSGISWAGGSAPTLTTTANKADVFGFICTGTNTYDGFVVGQNI